MSTFYVSRQMCLLKLKGNVSTHTQTYKLCNTAVEHGEES